MDATTLVLVGLGIFVLGWFVFDKNGYMLLTGLVVFFMGAGSLPYVLESELGEFIGRLFSRL
jgi:hypothetical protein